MTPAPRVVCLPQAHAVFLATGSSGACISRAWHQRQHGARALVVNLSHHCATYRGCNTPVAREYSSPSARVVLQSWMNCESRRCEHRRPVMMCQFVDLPSSLVSVPSCGVHHSCASCSTGFVSLFAAFGWWSHYAVPGCSLRSRSPSRSSFSTCSVDEGGMDGIRAGSRAYRVVHVLRTGFACTLGHPGVCAMFLHRGGRVVTCTLVHWFATHVYTRVVRVCSTRMTCTGLHTVGPQGCKTSLHAGLCNTR